MCWRMRRGRRNPQRCLAWSNIFWMNMEAQGTSHHLSWSPLVIPWTQRAGPTSSSFHGTSASDLSFKVLKSCAPRPAHAQFLVFSEHPHSQPPAVCPCHFCVYALPSEYPEEPASRSHFSRLCHFSPPGSLAWFSSFNAITQTGTECLSLHPFSNKVQTS